tara:strand:+ start:385 stop:708 length:324 start_codon:yes stop_codon:yes gene_type:complete
MPYGFFNDVLMKTLCDILDTMNIPLLRRDLNSEKKESNVRWLLRNLRVNNNNHPNIETVIERLKKLLNNIIFEKEYPMDDTVATDIYPLTVEEYEMIDIVPENVEVE